MFYYALPREGIELILRTGSAGLVKMQMVDWSAGFPEIPNNQIAPRPSYLNTDTSSRLTIQPW